MTFLRVLCVDDNPSMQMALKAGLEMYGFDIITASNGLDALTQYKIHSGNFTAIVTDHDMPKMGGLELVRSLREIGFKGRLVVISGHLKVDELQSYHVHVISGFFQKPFKISLLAMLLLQGRG